MIRISLFAWMFIIFITYSFLVFSFGVSKGIIVGRKEMLQYYTGEK